LLVGTDEGWFRVEGTDEGLLEGTDEGSDNWEGTDEGLLEGTVEGFDAWEGDGTPEGGEDDFEGVLEGTKEGLLEGSKVGAFVGGFVGAFVVVTTRIAETSISTANPWVARLAAKLPSGSALSDIFDSAAADFSGEVITITEITYRKKPSSVITCTTVTVT